MTRYADPTRCPDCGAAIRPGDTACGTCALSLRGDTAQQLFATLTRADDLLRSLRAASVPTVATVATVATAPSAAPTTATLPAYPNAPREQQPRRGLSAASVPKLLLGLGAGCLLVAALVFLAVTWSVLGVGGRTATLVALTGVAAGLSVWFARRDLRGAAESLALVAYGLLTLDVVGADHAGWTGGLSDAGLLVLVGAVLVAAGSAGTAVVRHTAAGDLVSGQVVAALGTAVAAFGVAVAEWVPVAPSLLLATLLSAAVVVAAYGARHRVTVVGAGLVTAAAWLALTADALDRAVEAPTWHELWARAGVWPLLAAAVLVAGLAVVRRLPTAVRVTALGAGVLLVVAGVTIPVLADGVTAAGLAGVAVLLVVAAATWSVPRPWALTGLPTQAVAVGGLVVVTAWQLGSAVDRVGRTVAPLWHGRAVDLLPPLDPEGPAPWLLPLSVLAVVATVVVLRRSAPGLTGVLPRFTAPRAAALLVVGVPVVALYPAPLWVLLAALLMALVGYTAWGLVFDEPALVPAALVAVVAVPVASSADTLSLALGLTATLAAAATWLAARTGLAAAAGGLVLPVTLAVTLGSAGHLADLDGPWVTVTTLVVLGALVLVAPLTRERWWRCGDPVLAWSGTEAGAAATALPLVLAGAALADPAQHSTWLAIHLTVAGVLVTLVALTRPDLRAAGWVGGLLLAAASWVRLYDVGVTAPEAYTLPSALVLLGAGLLHLRRRPGTSTMTALAPGLSLALVPSLLWVLADPTGWRTLLLGAACLALVLGGVRLGWTAPVLAGAGVGTLLVLRLSAPYVAQAVPRWVLLGLAGALLVAVGVTWERRLQDARHLVDQVRAMR